jgi:error-prone DNA polymerase
VASDYQLLGLAQDLHLLALYRPQLADLGVVTSLELTALPHGARAKVAGRLEVLQRPPPAKGIAFASIEDEHGLVNLLFYPDIYERCRRVLRAAPVLLADGMVQHERGSLYLIVERVAPVAVGEEVCYDSECHPHHEREV